MGRDSNPRELFRPNTLSKRAHSTTLPPIRLLKWHWRVRDFSRSASAENWELKIFLSFTALLASPRLHLLSLLPECTDVLRDDSRQW